MVGCWHAIVPGHVQLCQCCQGPRGGSSAEVILYLTVYHAVLHS